MLRWPQQAFFVALCFVQVLGTCCECFVGGKVSSFLQEVLVKLLECTQSFTSSFAFSTFPFINQGTTRTEL